MHFFLFYSGVGMLPWYRADSYKLTELTRLADEEQEKHDSCWVENQFGVCHWQPGLGQRFSDEGVDLWWG